MDITRALVLIVLIAVAFLAGQDCGRSLAEQEAEAALRAQLEKMASSHEETLVQRNAQVSSLTQALSLVEGDLDAARTESAVMAELVTSLRGRLRDVETLLSLDSQTQTGETVIVEVPVDQNFSQELLVRWQNGTPVAEVAVADGALRAKACDMTFRLRAAQSKRDTSFLLFSESGCDGETRPIELAEARTIRISEDNRVFSPRLGLGVSVGASGVENIAPLMTASLYLHTLHPIPKLSVLAPQVSVGSHIGAGVNLVGYRVSDGLPLSDDLWLHLGGGVVSELKNRPLELGPAGWGAWLTLGTRL